MTKLDELQRVLEGRWREFVNAKIDCRRRGDTANVEYWDVKCETIASVLDEITRLKGGKQ